MALETQVKNSCGEFTVFVDPDPLTYRSGEDIYTVQVINRTRTTRPQCGGPGGVPAGRRSERRAAMTTTDLTALFAALGIITVREAERRWGVKNMRQNGPDYPARVRLAGGRDWLTTEAAVRAVYGPELAARLAEVQALDLDDTTLEDWLSTLLDQLGAAFRQRHANDNAAQGREGE